MKSAIDWLINKSASIVGKNEEAFVSPSQSNIRNESTVNKLENDSATSEGGININGHSRDWPQTPSSSSREKNSPWGRSLTPKSPKFLTEKVTRGMSHALIAEGNRSSISPARNNSAHTTWDDLSFASEVTSPGFASRISKEAHSQYSYDGIRKYPIGQERLIRYGVLPNVRLKGQSKPVISARRAASSPLVPIATSPFSSSSGFLSSASTRMPDISSVVSVLESSNSTSAFETIKDPTSLHAVISALEQAQILKSGIKRSRFIEPEDSNKKHKFMNDSNIHEPIPIYSTPKVNPCFSSTLGEKRSLDHSSSSCENPQLSPENKRRCIPDPRIASLSSSKHITTKTLCHTQSSGRDTPFSMYDSHQDSDSDSNKSMESTHSKQSEQSLRVQANEIANLSNHDRSQSPQSNNGSSSSSRTATPSRPSHAFSLEAYKEQKVKSQQRLKKMLGMLFNVSDEEAQASIQAQKKVSKVVASTTTATSFTTSVPAVTSTTVSIASTKVSVSKSDVSTSFTFTVKSPPSTTEDKAPVISEQPSPSITTVPTTEEKNVTELITKPIELPATTTSVSSILGSSSSLTDLLSKGHKLTPPQLPKYPSAQSATNPVLPKSLSFLSNSPTSLKESAIGGISTGSGGDFSFAPSSSNSIINKSPMTASSKPLEGFSFSDVPAASVTPNSNTTTSIPSENKSSISQIGNTSGSSVPTFSFKANDDATKKTQSSTEGFSISSNPGLFSFGNSKPEISKSFALPAAPIESTLNVAKSSSFGVTTTTTSTESVSHTHSFSSGTEKPSTIATASNAGGFNFGSIKADTNQTLPVVQSNSPFSFGSATPPIVSPWFGPGATQNLKVGPTVVESAPALHSIAVTSVSSIEPTVTSSGFGKISGSNLNFGSTANALNFGSIPPPMSNLESIVTSSAPSFTSVKSSTFSFGPTSTTVAPSFGFNKTVSPSLGLSTTPISSTFGSTTTSVAPTFGSGPPSVVSTFGITPVSTAAPNAPVFGTGGGFTFSPKKTTSSPSSGGFNFGNSANAVVNSAINMPSTGSSKVTNSLNFGTASKTEAPSSIFTFGGNDSGGNNNNSSGFAFGAATKPTEVVSPFGSSFGSTADKGASKSLFGAKDNTTSIDLFGAASKQSTLSSSSSGTSMFGTTSAPASVTAFGVTNTSLPPPPYGSSTAGSISFGNSFAQPGATFGSSNIPTSTFGSSETNNMTFGSNSTAKSIPTFGSTNTQATTFGMKPSSGAAATGFGSSTGSQFGNSASSPFGSSAAAPAAGGGFGASTTASGSFGAQSSASPFGSSTANNAFSFGSSTNAPPSQGVFQFGTPVANPPPSNFNSAIAPPNFGATTPNFNAGPGDPSTNAPRRLKARYRRK